MAQHVRAARARLNSGAGAAGEGAESSGPGSRKQADLNKPDGREANVHLNKPRLDQQAGIDKPDGARADIHPAQPPSSPIQTEAAGAADTPVPGPLVLDGRRRWRDDELIAELRRVAALVEGPVLRVSFFNACAAVSSDTVQNRFGDWRSALDRAGLVGLAAPTRPALWRKRLGQRHSDAALLENLRRIARAKGSDGLSARDINRLGPHVTSRYAARFGSWPAAVERAGLRPVCLRRTFGEADCIDNLRLMWLHLRRPPRGAEMNRPPSTVAEPVYRRRWGSWSTALAAFVARVNATPDDPLRGAAALWRREAMRQGAGGMAMPFLPAEERQDVAARLRHQILTRDRFRCVLCGASPATDPAHGPPTRLEMDHILPFSRGGRTEAANLRTLCQACNAGRKGDHDATAGEGPDEHPGDSGAA